jgi:hypothetical protein
MMCVGQGDPVMGGCFVGGVVAGNKYSKWTILCSIYVCFVGTITH